MADSVRPPQSMRPTLPPMLPEKPPTAFTPVLGMLDHLGQVSETLWGAVRSAFKRPFEIKETIRQLEALGVKSLGIVAVTSIFIGMVMATQFAFGLRKFGGMEYTGRIVAITFARELAPTLTAVIVGGRIGAGMTAELGSMAVTEQLDAIRALGADPVKKLVLPRLVASMIVMPILGSLAFVLGFSGAMIITDIQFDVDAAFFYRSALETLRVSDYIAGAMKTPFFGAIIALVGCHFGMITRGGTAGVGNSTTRTVVVISITILIADFFLTKLAILFMTMA